MSAVDTASVGIDPMPNKYRVSAADTDTLKVSWFMRQLVIHLQTLNTL